MEPDQQLRNLRDFLMVYNRMTEICFQRCSSNFNYRSLTMEEERCADSCAGKLIRSNHRLMGTYVQLMPKMVQRRMEEMESKTAEAAKAAGAVEGAGAGVAALPEGSSLAEAPPLISSALSGAADSAPLQTPSTTGLSAEFPVDLVPAASVAVAAPPAPEGKMAAATSVTPAVETVLPSSLTTAVNEAAFTTVPPLESPLIIREPSTSVGVAAGAPPISVPIVLGNSLPVTSVPDTFTPAAPVMPVESSIVPPAGPQAPAASVVPLVSAPSAPVRVSPVENLDLPKTACSPAPSSSEVTSFSPSRAASTVTKQDLQPPS